MLLQAPSILANSDLFIGTRQPEVVRRRPCQRRPPIYKPVAPTEIKRCESYPAVPTIKRQAKNRTIGITGSVVIEQHVWYVYKLLNSTAQHKADLLIY